MIVKPPHRCVICGNECRGHGRTKTCSEQCRLKNRWQRICERPLYRKIKRARDRRYHEQNKDRCNAKSRDWAARNRERAANPDKIARQPSRIRQCLESEARIEARKRERCRHAAIMEAARQTEMLNWHIYGAGAGLTKERRGPLRALTPDERLARYKERNRERRREQRREQYAAIKIYREMGFRADTEKIQDWCVIYQALKLELNI